MAAMRTTAGVAAWMAAAALALSGCASAPPQARGSEDLVGAKGESELLLGVKVEGVRLSAAGYMLDFRYRVVDADKALVFFERKARPLLVDAATGLQLGVPNAPKLGQLRATGVRNVKTNRTYSMLFANPGRHVERGTKLALVIGEARIDGLTVE